MRARYKQPIALITLLLLTACAPRYELRYPPQRWLVDQDREPIQPPKETEETTTWDAINRQVVYQAERLGNLPEKAMATGALVGLGSKQEALNVNNFDEVADSSWFENRVGRRPLTDAEYARGPREGQGPDVAGTWTILKAKTSGITPGFFIKDSRGDLYLIKFDTPGFSELASGVEIIGTLFFHAFGYHVPENYITYFDPKILTVSPKAKTKDRVGRKVPFTVDYLQQIMKNVERNEDGTVRAMASKFLAGKPLGPFPLRGLRRGDSNDRIPHEHRRELRGYRVFSAFLDHRDSREANTLDMFIETRPDGSGYVKHHLIDFGTVMGSEGARGPRRQQHLYSYLFNYPEVLAATIALGFYEPFWQETIPIHSNAIGRLEAEKFQPLSWRPSYPNPGFQNMTDRDAFWATKILMKIPAAAFDTIVEQAQFSHSENRDYVVNILLQRRDKIARYWFDRLNPLDDFRLSQDENGYYLNFNDLAIDAGYYRAEDTQYQYVLRTLKRHRYPKSPKTANTKRIPLHASLMEKAHEQQKLVLTLRTLRRATGKLSPAVEIILQGGEKPTLLGIKRLAKPGAQRTVQR